MKTHLLAYRWTFLIGVAFLGTLAWSVATPDKLSNLAVLLCFFCILASVFVSITTLATHRKKVALYRVLLNVVFCLLILPTISLGTAIRGRIFLSRLPRFQEVTNLLVAHDAVGTEPNVLVVPLPAGFSDLNVGDRVKISRTTDNISVQYLERDSNALSHRGYMYRSDDSETSLNREYPRTGYTRIAPHWFFFSE